VKVLSELVLIIVLKNNCVYFKDDYKLGKQLEKVATTAVELNTTDTEANSKGKLPISKQKKQKGTKKSRRSSSSSSADSEPDSHSPSNDNGKNSILIT
jgi:hypothetical protein